MKAIRVSEETAEWARAGVHYVRCEAMVLGFGCSLSGEFGEDTPKSEYILVTDDDGLPLSTCRIHLFEKEGYAKIERVATVSYARGKGAGKLALIAAEDWIRERSYKKIVITSRDEAVGFYEKLGYTADYSVDVHSMFASPKKAADSEQENQSLSRPKFTVVYTEKIFHD